MTYQQFQKRNSEIFQALAKPAQKALKQAGYRNVGREAVERAWELLQAAELEPFWQSLERARCPSSTS